MEIYYTMEQFTSFIFNHFKNVFVTVWCIVFKVFPWFFTFWVGCTEPQKRERTPILGLFLFELFICCKYGSSCIGQIAGCYGIFWRNNLSFSVLNDYHPPNYWPTPAKKLPRAKEHYWKYITERIRQFVSNGIKLWCREIIETPDRQIFLSR